MAASLFSLLILILCACSSSPLRETNGVRIIQNPDSPLVFPELPPGNTGREILYGRELILNTNYYFGPKGIVKPLFKNATQCQNCHLDAGTRLYGNHLLLADKKYPAYFSRLGKKINLEERISLCIQDHYSGKSQKLPAKEMNAIKIYLKWIGRARMESIAPEKSSFLSFAYPGRRSSADRGRKVYTQHCQRCHGKTGQGERLKDSGFLYPPLWGEEGYSIQSPFFQNMLLAQFIRANMPLEASWENPILSEEEALDVAAYLNFSKKNHRWGKRDPLAYPNPIEKPLDFPFGPYTDPFSEGQHKSGPYSPILDFRKTKKLPEPPY